MKAAVLEGINAIGVQDIAVPKIDDDSVLVKVHACAICGSDIRILHSGNYRVQYPAVIGHEISGEVVSVGKNVTKFKEGQRVAIGADVPCGECPACEAGMGNNCEISNAIGYQLQGGFAEYMPLDRMTVNYGPVHEIPENVSYEEAALAEPLACVLNALEKTPIKFGATVVVIGAGPIGCMMTNVIREMGAGKIILVQRSKLRLEYAKKTVKADVFVCSSEEDPVARVLEETGGRGADLIITACPSGEAQQSALHMAKNCGSVNFFGGLPRDKEQVTLNTNVIHYKELVVTGAHGSVPAQHRQALKLISMGVVDVKPFISNTFALEDIEEAFRVAESHEGMRVVVKP